MINFCNTFLPKDKVQARPADIGKIIKPTPVTDKVIEVNVAPMITTESTDSTIVLKFYKFFYIFFDLLFLSLKYVNISVMLII